MKKLHPFPGIEATPPVTGRVEELCAAKKRFKKNQPFYLGLCAMMILLIIQSACKKIQTITVPVVTITGLNKTVFGVGDTLTITGTNFSTTPADNLVSVALVYYPVIKATATQLTVIVPKTAQSGQLSISFAQGQSTTFSQPLTVAGYNQPYVTSVTPAGGAYEMDTIAIKGGNFAIPYNYNTVTFNSVAGVVINVSDSVLKVVIPNQAQTGPMIITSKGFTSAPYMYTVLKVDPNADGHINWLDFRLSTSYPQTISESIFTAGITNTALPQTATFLDLKSPPTPAPASSDYFYGHAYASNFDNLVVNDQQNNAYYLTGTALTFPAQYSLMMLNKQGSAASPVQVWSQSFPAPGTTNKYRLTPKSTLYLVNYLPNIQLSMDGNIAYIKMGITDDYYVGDVSASPVTFALQHNVFGDTLAFKPQFTPNYIFYEELGGRGTSDLYPDFVTQVRYMARGSKVSSVVPIVLNLSSSERIFSIQADLTHGNNVMVFVSGTNNTYHTAYNTIYKFNADTKQLTTLYNQLNWLTGLYTLTGAVWLGNHIYFSNYFNAPNLHNALYRLDDNGLSTKARTVYSQLEPNGQALVSRFLFFLSK